MKRLALADGYMKAVIDASSQASVISKDLLPLLVL